MAISKEDAENIIIGYLEDNEIDIASDIDGFGCLKEAFEYYIEREPDQYGT